MTTIDRQPTRRKMFTLIGAFALVPLLGVEESQAGSRAELKSLRVQLKRAKRSRNRALIKKLRRRIKACRRAIALSR